MNSKRTLLFTLIMIVALAIQAQTTAQFRGPERTGVFPEQNLLPGWPEGGPQLLWKAEGIGNGYSSPVITSDRIYVTGEIDSIGYLFAYDKKGTLAWKTRIGKEWTINFPGPRSTVTVVNDLLYYCSSMGEIICFEAAGGQKKWSTHMVDDLHGILVRFGYAESLLIDGDLLYCAPGGADTNVAALNRFTGKLVWKTKAMGDSTSYGSPALINLPGRKILTTLTIHHLIGVDAATSEFLWSYKTERLNDIHCNIPCYENGFIYLNDRAGNGIVKLELARDGKTVKEIWRNFKAGNVQSGSIMFKDVLYGSRYRPARFESVETTEGKILDSLKFATGSTIFADGLLYCYGEDGTMGLIRPDQGKLSLAGSFKVTDGTQEHFAHPAIHDGVLYIRHGNVLLAYNIRKK